MELSVWNQPKDLSFTTSKPELGGRVSLHSEQIWNDRMRTFVEISYKTQGWYAAELHLDDSLNFILGANFSID